MYGLFVLRFLVAVVLIHTNYSFCLYPLSNYTCFLSEGSRPQKRKLQMRCVLWNILYFAIYVFAGASAPRKIAFVICLFWGSAPGTIAFEICAVLGPQTLEKLRLWFAILIGGKHALIRTTPRNQPKQPRGNWRLNHPKQIIWEPMWGQIGDYSNCIELRSPK